MQQFSKRIDYGKDSLTFYFNNIYTVEGDRYHVSVVGRDKKVYSFLMKMDGERWIITNPDNCPDWIVHLQDFYSTAIIETI
jgi:hypothetical protein